MHRRRFLLSGAVPLTHAFRIRRSVSVQEVENRAQTRPDIFSQLLRATDNSIPRLLSQQERRKEHPKYGGVSDAQGIYGAGNAASFIKTLCSALCAPGSRFRNSSELVLRMEQAARFLLSLQHQDGTIDLYTTNFHSPPDTAFAVEPLAAAAAVLKKEESAGFANLKSLLERFLRIAGRALVRGGIHTPNHRWVVCSALARLNSLFPSKEYVTRIDEWLGEGIDIDGDGQFTERSTSIYSPAVDNALLTVGRFLSRPYLFDPVRRNLAMTLYYLHADGEIATEGSRRQDQYVSGSVAGYHIPYRFLALQDRSGQFATMARLIENKHGEGLSGNLIYFLEEPSLRKELPEDEALPTDFVKPFPHSDLIRIRRGAVSATILGANPTFFSFHKGSAALQSVRLATAFFGKGQFQGAKVESQPASWILRQSLVGPYYQPLPSGQRRADGDWSKMSLAQRAQSEVQKLDLSVEISEENNGFVILIDIVGCDDVPFALELAFRRGGTLNGVLPLGDAPDTYLLDRGTGRYVFEGQSIEFGPGQADHRYIQVRGALPKPEAPTVYLTGFTPFRKRLTIG